MSSRPILTPFSVITDGNMSLSSISSAVTVIQNLSMISYAVSWTGTSPVGTLEVQVSNDYSQNSDGTVRNSGTWTNIYFSVNGVNANSIAVSGNTGSGFIDIDLCAAYAIRLHYTKTSGIGTLNATANGKVS